MRKRVSRNQLLLLMGLFYFLGISLYVWYSYERNVTIFKENVDRQLGWAASTAALFLPKNYHQEGMKKEQLSKESYLRYARLLTQLNDEFKTSYIYSFIQRGDTIYYTSTSYKDNEWENAYKKDYLEAYPSATNVLKSAFISKKISYEVSEDKFGTFKSVFIPLTAEDGSTFVMGADLEISYIETYLQNAILHDMAVGFYFLLILLPIGMLYRQVEKKDKELLELTVEKRTAELNQANSFLNTLSNKLSRYLSPQIKEMLFEGKGHTEIRSTRKKLTVYFSDIKNFTVTTAHLEPEELTFILNTYFDAMNEIAIKHGATIDKYIGDAILIFTGDPKSRGEKEDALACVSMAIEMRDKTIELQKVWKKAGFNQSFRVRAGVNTGFVTVGNFGSQQRMDYTIVGSQVNIAARLEGLAQEDNILISHETYSLVKDKIECIKDQEVRVKGIDWPIQTYKVIGFLDEKHKIYDIDSDGVSIFVNMNRVEKEHQKSLEDKIEEIKKLITKKD